MSVRYSSYPKATFTWSKNSYLSYVIINWTGSTTATSGTYTSGSIYSPIITYTTGDLSFNTTYTFTLTPYNKYGSSGTANTMTVNTTPATNGIYATYTTSSTAQIQWYGSYTYVKVRRSYYKYDSGILIHTGFKDVSSIAISNPYTDYDLSGNTIYMYYITPYLNGSLQSDTEKISLLTNVQVPTDVSVNKYDASAILISFTYPKNSYSTSSSYTAIAVDKSNNTIYTDITSSPSWIINLSGDTQYTCYVKVTLDSNSSLTGTSAGVTQTTNKTLAQSITTIDTASSTVKFVVLSGIYTTSVTGTYTLVKFTGNSVIQTASTISSVPTLIVGGGGGGASNYPGYTEWGGGGGAGGLGVGTISFSNSTYVITVGAGGNGGSNGSDNGKNGGSSIIYGGTIYETANGGGYGIMGSGTSGSGGSSGGVGQNVGASVGTATKGSSNSTSGASITYYGNSGSVGSYGGGGGAGGAGGVKSGGSGYTWSVNSTTYAAGGTSGGSASASANTGNGGAGSAQYSGLNGGNGGSGIVICAFTTSTTLLCVDDMSGIKLYYKFDSGDMVNSAILNYANNSYDATAYNTSTSISINTNSTYYKVGTGSAYCAAPSTLGYISLPDLTANVNGYTFSFWFYSLNPTRNSDNTIFMLYNNSSSSNGRVHAYIQANTGKFYVGTTAGTDYNPFTVSSNTWYHIVWTLTNSGYSTVHVNGGSSNGGSTYTSSTTGYISKTFSSSYSSIFGDYQAAVGSVRFYYGFYGYLDEFRYYDAIIDSATIVSLYNQTKSSAKISSFSGSSSSASSATLSVSCSNTSYVVIKNITTNTFSGPYSVNSGTNQITVYSLSYLTTYSFVAYPFDSNGYQGTSSPIISVTTTGLTFVNDISGLILYYKFESSGLSSDTKSLYNYATKTYDATFGTGSSLSTSTYYVESGSLYNPSTTTGDGLTIQSFSLTSGSFSCSYWWYYGSSTTGNPRIWQFTSGGTTYSNRAFSNSSYVSMFCFDNLGGSNYWNPASTVLTVNTWNHMTITFDTYSKSLKYYLNGTLQYTSTFNVSLAGTCSSVSLFPSTYYIAGYLDDFRFYNQIVLSSSQISQIYSAATVSAKLTYSSTTITNVDSSSVLISFAGTNTSYYVIYNKTTAKTYGQDYTITTSPYTINGLSTDITYNFYVIPYNSSAKQGLPSQLLSTIINFNYIPELMWFKFSDTTNYASAGLGNATLTNTAYLNVTNNSLGYVSWYSYNTSSANFEFPSFNANYNGYTISFWAQSSFNGSGGSYFYLKASNGSYLSVTGGNASTPIYVNIYNATKNYTVNGIVSSTFSSSTFTHVVVTISFSSTTSATYNLYLNGVLKSTSTSYAFDGSVTYNNNYASANNIGTNSFWIGDFRLYNSVVSQSQVTYIYNMYNSSTIVSSQNLLWFYFKSTDFNGYNIYNYATSSNVTFTTMVSSTYTSDTTYPNGCLYYKTGTLYGAGGSSYSNNSYLYAVKSIQCYNSAGITISFYYKAVTNNAVNSSNEPFNICYFYDSTTTNRIEIFYTYGGTASILVISQYNGSTSSGSGNPGSVTFPSTWNFVAVRFNTDCTVDLNTGGTWKKGLYTSSGLISTTFTNFYIGRNAWNWGGYTSAGYLYDFRLWNYALSDTQISTVKSGGTV